MKDLQATLDRLPSLGSKVRVYLYPGLGNEILTEEPKGILDCYVEARQIWAQTQSGSLSLSGGWTFSPITEGDFEGTFAATTIPGVKDVSNNHIRARIEVLQ